MSSALYLFYYDDLMDSFTIKKIPVRKRRQRPDPTPVSPPPTSRRRSAVVARSSGSYGSLPRPDYKQYAFYAIGTIIAIAVIYVVLKLISAYNAVKIDNKNAAGTSVQPAKKKTIYNVLLTGYGGEGHDGSYLTDTIMIAHIDKEKKKVVLFSVPRDLWVKIPGASEDDAFYAKINAVYQAGLFSQNYPGIPQQYQGKENAPALLKKVVNDVTGLDIDYFVGIDFDGFVKFIDMLGGVEVNIQKTFDDYYYPVSGKEDDVCGREPKPTLTEDQLREERERYEAMSEEEKKTYDNRPISELSENEFQRIATEEPELAFPCRYEHLHFDAGPTKMDGTTALKFARSRKSLQDGGDFNRAARQQLVVEAIKDKVLSIGFIPKILPTIDILSNHITTDISLAQMQEFLKEAPSVSDYKISTYVINHDGEPLLVDDYSSDGQYILRPEAGLGNYKAIHDVVNHVVNGISPTPSPSRTPASDEAELEE
jgi:LCP family protein required for cell wall assembly